MLLSCAITSCIEQTGNETKTEESKLIETVIKSKLYVMVTYKRFLKWRKKQP